MANLVEEIEPVVFNKQEFKNKDLAILAISGYQNSDARNKLDDFYIDLSTKGKTFLIEKSRKKTRSVVLVNYELDYRKKFKSNASCLAFSTHHNSNSRTKFNTQSHQKSFTTKVLSDKTSMKKTTLVATKKHEFVSRHVL